jgi:hypothetical protein
VRRSVLHLVCCCCRPVGGAQAHGHQPRQRHTSGTGAAGAHSRSEHFLIHGTRCTWWCWQSTPSLDVYWVHCSDSLCCPRGAGSLLCLTTVSGHGPLSWKAVPLWL